MLLKVSLILCFVITSILNLSGCNQAVAYIQTTPAEQVPHQLVKQLDHLYQTRFVYGDWRYQEITSVAGNIEIFIQIPDKLELSTDQQIGYIEQLICPKANEEIWTKLRPYPLTIHLYTTTKRDKTSAQCPIPLA